MLAAVAGVVLLVVVVGLYFLLRSDSDSPSATKPSQQSSVQPAAAQKQAGPQTLETYTIDCAEGRADVYSNGVRVGDTGDKGYHFQAKSGEQFDFVLKREGYLDKSVRLTTTENKKTYTFMMDKKY